MRLQIAMAFLQAARDDDIKTLRTYLLAGVPVDIHGSSALDLCVQA